MKKLLISIFLLATIASAEPLWNAGRAEDWQKNKKGVQDHLVELLNPQTTNTLYTTSGVPYQVTNYTHTAENTNNVLWQMNFGLIDEKGNDCWIFGYDTLKCGGFDIDAQWAILETYCLNNKKLTCGRGMGLQEFMQLNGYSWKTNQWLTLDIPFVDDSKKVNERKKEYKESKKGE